MEGNRVLRTVVLTDAVGFTARMQANEPEALAALAADQRVFEHQFKIHGGDIIKRTGDGFLVVFESAASAVIAAREAQEALANSTFRHRIGIHAGEVTLASGDAYGDAVNICSRLEEFANPGEILVSETVWSLVQSQAIDKPKFLGQKTLKGVSSPISIYSWQSGDAPKRRSQFNFKLFGIGTALVAALAIGATVMSNFTHPRDADSGNAEKTIEGIRSRGKADSSKSDAANNSGEASDIDMIMDEAYAQVMEELDAFEAVKERAVAECDAKLVLKWIAENPFGKSSRGQLETEHWTLVDIAITRAKEILGRKAQSSEIENALESGKQASDKLALKAFREEFTAL